MSGSVLQVDFGAVAAGCEAMGVTTGYLEGDVGIFHGDSGRALTNAGGGGVAAAARFNDSGRQTVLAMVEAVNRVRGVMGKVALEMESLDVGLGRVVFGGTDENAQVK